MNLMYHLAGGGGSPVSLVDDALEWQASDARLWLLMCISLQK